MVGYHTKRDGRYKCEYCNHTSYKTLNGVLTHLQDKHYHEVQEARLLAEIDRLKNLPPKIEVREKVVYKDKPELKYWYTKTVGIAGIYCSSCKQVTLNPGIPTGQTIENTPHQCGNRTLFPVVEVR